MPLSLINVVLFVVSDLKAMLKLLTGSLVKYKFF